jgi:predicted  nucleic acid-binding Zn-ribbon protein
MGMKVQTIKKALEKHRDRIGKERDALRDLESEITDLKETCERAYDDINCAIDALSELA